MIESVTLRYVEFAIDHIVVGERKRQLGDISSLAQSINELGLFHPITITPDGMLLIGYHRLEACKLLGWKTIPAILGGWEELHTELAEIDENIVRLPLKEIEQARQLHRRKEIYETLHPETKRGGDRKSNGHNDRLISSFAKDAAQKTGKVERSIRRSTQIASNISPDLDKAIINTPIADDQDELLQLARLEPEKQKAVIEKLTTGLSKDIRGATTLLRQEENQQAFANTSITQDDCKVYHCPIANLRDKVKQESLDAIITDPPYEKKALPVYEDLARFADYALKPGGSLLIMIGQLYLPDIYHIFWPYKETLTYAWQFHYRMPGTTVRIWPRKIASTYKPILWFIKGTYTAEIWHQDNITGRKGDKGHHKWGQPVDIMEDLVEQFTLPEALVCDPFVGGGSTAVASINRKRRFVGCDVDEQCVQRTKQRIGEAFASREDASV